MLAKQNSLVFHKIETVPISKVIVWDEVEARQLDLDGIEELTKSIKEEGLQNPPVVQKNKDGTFKLIAGQRRLEALKRIGSKNIPVMVVKKPYNDENAKAVSIIENLHRKQMNSQEMAQACDFLVKSMKSTKKAAKALGISQQTLRTHVGFNSIPTKLQELVPKIISKNEALQLYRINPKIDSTIEIANRIQRYSPDAKKRYLDALALDPGASHGAIRRMANHFREKQNIRLKLSKTQAKTLAKESAHMDLEPEDLVRKIVSDWISRKS